MDNQNKHLPIILFQKRNVDTRETEGGGGGDPKWVLSDEELSHHAALISAQFSQSFSKYLDVDDEAFLVPIPIGVKLKEKATAKSHRESIEKVFVDKDNKISSIGFSPRDELLFALNTKEHIKRVGEKLEKPEHNKKGVSAISGVEKYRPVVEKKLEPTGKLKVKLIPYENITIRKQLQRYFTRFCEERNITIRKCNYTAGSEIYKIGNVTQDCLNEMVDFSGVLSIESMPTYELGPEWISENKDVAVKMPEQDKRYAKVGILDSGISKISQLSPWMCGEMSPYSEDELDKTHGTFVAGVLLYGDILEDKEMVGCDECEIYDGAVISDRRFGPVDEDELLDNIREIIRKNKEEIKVWSLSIGSKKEASLQVFSDFGKVLDEIQDDYGVLIVKSAGNCRNFESGKPPSRIAESADSVRAVVVGSIAHRQSQTDIAPVNHVSPFSRVGPGPQYIIKPELVQYGGNSGLSATGMLLNTGVSSFSTDGKIVRDCGTSFSTPRVSALLANLSHKIKGDFNGVLIKTLSMHAARYPQEVKDPTRKKLIKYGFGLPPSINDILLNSPNEITLILHDELPKGNFIEILDFPFPNNLVDENGYYIAEIIVTLVNHQILDDSQGKEYCQSDIEIAFGTYDAVTSRDVNKPNIKNPIGRINSINILKTDLYSKKEINGTGLAFEPTLIQNGKYHPVKKFHCDLSRMTNKKKQLYISAPKKWFLKLNGLYRSKTERIFEESRVDLSQRFCLAITIRDRLGQHDVYNQVAQLLDQGNFMHQQIELEQDVRVRN